MHRLKLIIPHFCYRMPSLSLLYEWNLNTKNFFRALIAFVEKLYTPTYDLVNKKQHKMVKIFKLTSKMRWIHKYTRCLQGQTLGCVSSSYMSFVHKSEQIFSLYVGPGLICECDNCIKQHVCSFSISILQTWKTRILKFRG